MCVEHRRMSRRTTPIPCQRCGDQRASTKKPVCRWCRRREGKGWKADAAAPGKADAAALEMEAERAAQARLPPRNLPWRKVVDGSGNVIGWTQWNGRDPAVGGG